MPAPTDDEIAQKVENALSKWPMVFRVHREHEGPYTVYVLGKPHYYQIPKHTSRIEVYRDLSACIISAVNGQRVADNTYLNAEH